MQATTFTFYVAYADDHRGHGKTAAVPEKAGIAGPDAWNGIMMKASKTSWVG